MRMAYIRLTLSTSLQAEHITPVTTTSLPLSTTCPLISIALLPPDLIADKPSQPHLEWYEKQSDLLV